MEMTKYNDNLTQERLKELLHYNPDTGDFTWIVTKGGVLRGSVAGSKDNYGYLIIRVDVQRYKAHRLAFLYMENKFPLDQVDHINRIRDDNRWINLRNATGSENQQNKVSNTDFIGVSFQSSIDKWVANSTQKGGKRKHLGVFKTHLAACYRRWAYDLETL
jgi:hypothetical protein